MRRARNAAPLRGRVVVPGDKSISHRALIVAALSEGSSRVTGLNKGRDVAATASCLQALGVPLELLDGGTTAQVDGSGWPGLKEADDVLDAGNSGTTLRLLTGVMAAVPGHHVLTGDASLRTRPMSRIVMPLRAMGASISGRAGASLAPLSVTGSDLRGIAHRLPMASAQVKSALLLAGLAAEGRTEVQEPGPSRDHTERMLRSSGVRLESDGLRHGLDGGQRLSARDRVVPGDISSAMFLIVAAAVTPGSDLTIEKVGLNPTRIGALEAIRDMGADVTWTAEGGDDDEPIGSVSIRYADLRGTVVSGDVIPRLIDEIPALAVLATQAEGTTRFDDIGELRVKESDRIAALTEGLKTLGADVEATHDSITISGPTRLGGGAVDSFGDHRIALACAVAGTIATEDVRIAGWSSVETSFPEFVALLGEARGRR